VQQRFHEAVHADTDHQSPLILGSALVSPNNYSLICSASAWPVGNPLAMPW